MSKGSKSLKVKKSFFAGLVALMFLMGGSAQAQLLYKISGKGLDKASYIVGTYHLAPASFADSIPGLRAAFGATEQVCGEVDVLETLKPENLAKMQEAQMLPEGKTLSSLLTQEQLDRLNALLREVMGMDLTNPAVAEQLDKVTPMAMETTLTLMLYMKNVAAINPADMIDSYFQREAMKEGKGVVGFETSDFQMDILYGAPLEKQVETLMCFVDNYEEQVEMADFITTAYFAQNLEQLEELNLEEQEGACASNPEDNDKLLYDRNVNWVKAMPGIMKEKPTFFAVGAFHLCGERGVLKMLEAEGYKIEAVKK